MKNFAILCFFICILLLGLPSLIVVEGSLEQDVPAPQHYGHSAIISPQQPQAQSIADGEKTETLRQPLFCKLDTIRLRVLVIGDSNGNPVSVPNYQDAVYFAFHPDDEFG